MHDFVLYTQVKGINYKRIKIINKDHSTAILFNTLLSTVMHMGL